MDPQHRLLLEATTELVQASSLAFHDHTAAIIGIAARDTAPGQVSLPLGQYSATGSSASVAVGR